MKPFFKGVFLFVFILLGLTAGSFYLVVIHFSKNPFSKPYKTIFLGDSRIQYLYYNKQNLAYNSETFQFSFYKLKALNQDNHVDTLYLGCSHHSFSNYFDGYTQNEEEILPRYFVVSPHKLQILREYHFLNLHFLIKKQFEMAFNAISGNKNFIPGGFESPYNRVVDFKKLEKRIKQQFFEGKKVRGFSRMQDQYFDSITGYCKQNKIALILINSPVHPFYKKNIPQKYLDYYLQKMQQFTVLDLSDLFTKNDEFMPDGDHISWKAHPKSTHYINVKRHEFSKSSQ